MLEEPHDGRVDGSWNHGSEMPAPQTVPFRVGVTWLSLDISGPSFTNSKLTAV